MARKTIEDVRSDLNKEKTKVTKLRRELAGAQRAVWNDAIMIAKSVSADYPEGVFFPPKEGSSPDCFSAAGARMAANRVASLLADARRRSGLD